MLKEMIHSVEIKGLVNKHVEREAKPCFSFAISENMLYTVRMENNWVVPGTIQLFGERRDYSEESINLCNSYWDYVYMGHECDGD